MKTSFLGQAYQSRSPILATQTAINIYPEVTETGGSDVGGFYGTPGLISRYTGSGEVRGLLSAEDGNLYAVIGNTVYRIDTNWNATSLGVLPNATGIVSMVDNGSQIAVAHALGMHWVAYTGTAIAPVTNAPQDAMLDVQDNYVLFTNAGRFGITALGDLSSIDPLDIATAEGSPDATIAIASLNREVWPFGTRTIEVWSNTGAALFPFERAPAGFIEQGCSARRSVVKLDQSLFWLSRDKSGKDMVMRNQAYSGKRISTHAIEYELSQMSRTDDAFGFGYQQDGHTFYVLTFPTGQQTWVYDIAAQGWHQRAYQSTEGLLQRHRANCYAFFNGLHIVGDYENGKIYEMSLTAYDDDGQPIYRERAWELPDNENKRIRGDYMEVVALSGDGEAGTNPLITLEVSQDGGRRWGYERIQPLGKIGQNLARVRWRRLGTGRNTVYRVSTEMRNRVQWINGIFKGEALSQ